MNFADREAETRHIRDRVDIVDLISDYVTLKRAGANYKGLCPFHDDKTPSLHVHPGKQIFKCFACGAGGDVFKFIQLRENVDFLDARRMLAERAGIELSATTSRSATDGPGKVELARVNRWAAAFFRQQYQSPAGQVARDYVARRGIEPKIAEVFGIGYAADSFDTLLNAAQKQRIPVALLAAAGLVRHHRENNSHYDTFRHRLMFPIVDATDRIIGFGGRTLGDDPAKYMNTPENLLFEKGRNVFGLRAAKDTISESRRAVVVEGYTDCIMAHQYGFSDVVATLGTAFTADQAKLLRRYADTVVLVFDADAAGEAAADRALSVSLAERLDVRVAGVLTGKDPCDFLLEAGAEAFDLLLNGAPSAIEFKWTQVCRRFQADTSGPARHRAMEALLQQVASWTNAGAVDVIQRGLLLNQIGKLLALPADDVHTRLLELQRRARSTRMSPVANAEGSDSIRLAPAEDVIHAAVRQVVEVLINEPSLAHAAGPALRRQAMADRVLADVVGGVLDWCEAGCETQSWRLDELIGRFDDPAYGRIITDLAMLGEKRGNHEATLEGALQRLAALQRSQEAAQAARSARDAQDRDTQDAALRAVHASGQSHRHFASPSALRLTTPTITDGQE